MRCRKAQNPLIASGVLHTVNPLRERLAAEHVAFAHEANPYYIPSILMAEVGERLRFMFRLAGRQKVPRPIRQSLDRLAELDQKIELRSSPSIVPSEDEGWLSRLLPKRFR